MGELKNFLRNNFRPGEWLGQFCTPRQHNRIANVLQGIQGVNCRIDKPTNHEGRDWRVIIDGSSDIISDGNPTPPWELTNIDQFRAIQVKDQYKLYLKWSTAMDVAPTDTEGSAITWAAYPSAAGTYSLPKYYTGDTAITEWLWWQINDLGGAGEELYFEFTTTALPPDPGADYGGLVCKVVYDPAASPKLTISDTSASTFAPGAPWTKDAIRIRGGLWQYLVGTNTKTVNPSGAIWSAPAGESTACEDVLSGNIDCSTMAAGAIWAKLDLTSVDPVLTLEQIAGNPTWADNVYFNKLVSFATTIGATPEQTRVKIHQYHAGSIDVSVGGGHPAGSAWLTGAEDTTLSVTPEALDFTDGYTSNASLLVIDYGSANSITVKKKGIYTITLGARLKVQVTAIPTTSNNYVSASVKINGTASGDIPALYLEENDVAASYGSVGYIKLRECNSFDIALAADDVITASVFGTDTSQLTEGRLTVRLVHLQS
jgi:hypothetical protein